MGGPPSSSRLLGTERRARFARLDRAIVALALLAAWQLTAALDVRGIVGPLATARCLVRFAASGDLWHHTRYTMAAAGTGLVLGAVPGIALPFAIHRFEASKRVLAPFLAAAYGAPKVALAPVLVVWFGIGLGSKIALVTSIVFFLVFYLTNAGLERVSEPLVQSARVMGADDGWVAREILWPSALPYVLAAVRVAVPQAIGGAVVGELISSNQGLGYVIVAAATEFDPATVLTAVAVLTAITVVLGALLDRVERRLLAWRPPVSLADDARATL